MDKKENGFTIIEVSIFLAVTGFITAAFLAGFFSNLSRQRYTDSVQNFAEYLRTAYAEVESPQNSGKGVESMSDACKVKNSATPSKAGRSSCAIYGKYIVFGNNGKKEILKYTVVGRLVEKEEADTTEKALKLIAVNENSLFLKDELAYSIVWEGQIQEKDSKNVKGASVLIVRSPIDGTIKTFYLDKAEPNIRNFVENMSINPDVDFCVYTDDVPSLGGVRRDVRLKANSINANSIELIENDSADNRCK